MVQLICWIVKVLCFPAGKGCFIADFLSSEDVSSFPILIRNLLVGIFKIPGLNLAQPVFYILKFWIEHGLNGSVRIFFGTFTLGTPF
jgi:hypothetical protein